MIRILKDYLYGFVGLTASIITIILFTNNLYPALSADGRVAVLFIGGLFIWFFFENVYLKIRWGRERRYAQTLVYIADGFSEIHNLYRKNITVDNAVGALTHLCDNLAQTFTLITGTKCRASVKILTREDNALKAITFCRNRDPINNPKNNTIKHWLDKNTDFLEVFDKIDAPGGAYFFSNLLPFRYGYQNTSFEVYKGKPDNNLLLRYLRWTLPYRSTIVMPICPCSEQNQKMLVGFLCIDSAPILAFKADYDVPLLEGVADGIYNLIRDAADALPSPGESAEGN